MYDLVNSLTKSEKRYLKVRAGSGDKDYLQLMDALIGQQTFDEGKLIEDHKGANFLKHLAVNKRYLYELILRSLTQFGQQKAEHKVFEKFASANILLEKGMIAAALSELKKGQKIAKKYELFDLQITLSSIEKKMFPRLPSKAKNDAAIQQIFDSEERSLTQLKNINEYWHLAQQIVQFQTQFQKIQNEDQRKHIEKLTQSPLFLDPSLATNFKSKLYFYQANATYQFILGDVEQAYQINKQFLDVLDEHPHFLKIYAERYLGTLNNMLIDSLVIGKYDILQEGINRLVMLLERPEFKSIKNIGARIFRQRYLLLLNWSLSQRDFARASELIPEIENGLKEFEKKLTKHHRITFYYLTAYTLFQNRRFDQALQWNNFILNDPKENVVKEIFHFARILNLLIHYELGNHDLLSSLLLSTPKYLKARRTIYKTEKRLFRFLGKLLNQVDKEKRKQLIEEFKADVNVLFGEAGEKRVFNYLDLRLWPFE